jgi:NitT/TauT family transport system substrate-binding protein
LYTSALTRCLIRSDDHSFIIYLFMGCRRARAASMKLRLLLEYFHPWPNAAGFFVARARGFYAAAGLDVAIGVHDPARGDTLAHLLRQEADLGVFPPNRLLVRREAGEKLAAVATVNHVALETIQTFAGSGITRPRDLAGRRVAYNPTPRGRAMVRHLVAADGGDPDQVITVDSGVREWSVDDLVAGDADATYGGYWAWDALFGTLPPARRIVWRVQDIGAPPYPSYLLGGHEDTLRAQGGAIEAFLDATGAGFAHAADEPAHALHVLEQMTPYFPRPILAASLRLVAPTWTDGGAWGRHRADLLGPYAAWMAEHRLLRNASAWPTSLWHHATATALTGAPA